MNAGIKHLWQSVPVRMTSLVSTFIKVRTITWPTCTFMTHAIVDKTLVPVRSMQLPTNGSVSAKVLDENFIRQMILHTPCGWTLDLRTASHVDSPI